MQSLTDDIFSCIFKFVDIVNIPIISLVCRQFNNNLQINILWDYYLRRDFDIYDILFHKDYEHIVNYSNDNKYKCIYKYSYKLQIINNQMGFEYNLKELLTTSVLHHIHEISNIPIELW